MNACRQLSVVIKAFNEEANVARTISCALAATAHLDTEVILADALSEDNTVAIAKTFPVGVVQLKHLRDRGCGSGGQLGFQHSHGHFVLLMDGDMQLQRDFVDAALALLQAEPDLAGVGGIIEDLNLENIEYRARKQRAPRDGMAGEVDRLNGGGLFRREALESIGFATNHNLHACEELDQGLRLRARGWRLRRLPMTSVLHHGHTAPLWTLVRRRWRSRYVDGAGELLRAAWGAPHWWAAVRSQRHPLTVLAWLSCLLTALVGAGLWTFWPAALLLTLPFVLLLWRKRSLQMAAYAMLAWLVDAAGMVRGVCTRQRHPQKPIESVTICLPPQ